MNWDQWDYLAALVLLGGACAGILAVWKFGKSRRVRIGGIIGVLLVLALIWIQLAVGIFD